METKFKTDSAGFVINDVNQVTITLKENYNKKDLEQKIINDLYKKEIYSAEDVELIKLILKD